jgi:hypothetical protein
VGIGCQLAWPPTNQSPSLRSQPTRGDREIGTETDLNTLRIALTGNANEKENGDGKDRDEWPAEPLAFGVVQDPYGDEGFRLGGWFVQLGGKDLEVWNKVALEEALRAEAWLLGRRSYEFVGARRQPRSGELADRLNGISKYIVSSTLEDPKWNNSTVLKGDVVTESRS